jgi:hypothetical protein
MMFGRKHSMKSHLRYLDKVAYRVIEDPEAIHEFVDEHLRREWKERMRVRGGDPTRSPWLLSLSRRAWKLSIVELGSISLSSRIMNYVAPWSGYNYREDLSKRVTELRKSMQRSGLVIRPIVIRAEDSRLMDGYCRYHTLKYMRISRSYAYSGRLQ